MDIIRLTEKKDYDDIYKLQLYLDNYCAKINPRLFHSKSKLSKKEKLRKQGNGKNSFVFEYNGEIIGHFDAYTMSALDKSGYVCSKTFIVETFVIKEKYQNIKYGEKLFKYLEKFAKKGLYRDYTGNIIRREIDKFLQKKWNGH
jgi:hypothetical protein